MIEPTSVEWSTTLAMSAHNRSRLRSAAGPLTISVNRTAGSIPARYRRVAFLRDSVVGYFRRRVSRRVSRDPAGQARARHGRLRIHPELRGARCGGQPAEAPSFLAL